MLLDAWIQILTAWDGTTPQADIGTFVGSNNGLFNWAVLGSGAVDMTAAVSEPVGTGIAFPSEMADVAQQLAAYTAKTQVRTAAGVNPTGFQAVPGNSMALGQGGIPGVFTAANPVKVCVSQDGTNNGADPVPSHGSAVLYLITATPA